MDNMKFIISNRKAVNLATINTISISNNYLTLTTEAGQNAREILFVYGTKSMLEKLFDAIMAFLADENAKVFDCDKFLSE